MKSSKEYIGRFKVYKKEYASTSGMGWYEVMKTAPKEWMIYEYYPDGSCDKRTFETTKSEAIKLAKKLGKRNHSQAPYYIDHGVKYYNQEAY